LIFAVYAMCCRFVKKLIDSYVIKVIIYYRLLKKAFFIHRFTLLLIYQQ
jgi:hypothetical protein